jgi:K+-sensing histidine kinase KdpD
MSNTRCQAFNWLLIPLIAIVIGVLTMHLGVIELYLLFAYAIFVFAAHTHYGICVVCNVLDVLRYRLHNLTWHLILIKSGMVKHHCLTFRSLFCGFFSGRLTREVGVSAEDLSANLAGKLAANGTI